MTACHETSSLFDKPFKWTFSTSNIDLIKTYNSYHTHPY